MSTTDTSRSKYKQLFEKGYPASIRSDEGLTLEAPAPESLYGGNSHYQTQSIKPNYLVILPQTQHHSFFINLPPPPPPPPYKQLVSPTPNERGTNSLISSGVGETNCSQGRERFSNKRGKAYATMSKVIMGNGGFYGCLIEPRGVSAWSFHKHAYSYFLVPCCWNHLEPQSSKPSSYYP